MKLHGLPSQPCDMEELPFLLKRHQRFSCSLGVLVEAEDAPHSLHRFDVPGPHKKFEQDILVDIFEYVGHRFLAIGSVKFVSIDGRTDTMDVLKRARHFRMA